MASQIAHSDFNCSLYIAHSTIPGAGLGVFTGQNRSPGETLGDGEIYLPIVDLTYHMSELIQFSDDFLAPTEDYVWEGPSVGMFFESSNPFENLAALGPGLNGIINCHFALNNVVQSRLQPASSHCGNLLHRSKDPGVGAFSPYHNSTTVATMTIPAGSELFKDYGERYFNSRDVVPVTYDYAQAKKLLRKFQRRIMLRSDLTDDMKQSYYNLIRDLPLQSRVLKALPPQYHDITDVLDHGFRNYYQNRLMRSIDDLEAHGRCLDKIRHGPSTLPQAGHGAFATRFIGKGEAVSGSPLLVFPNDDFFNMYDGDWLYKTRAVDTSKVVHRQILYNYCLHHPDSSMYFFPNNAGVNFINHNKTLANVELRWAQDGELGHREELLMQHPVHMMNKSAPGLFVDYVATRDIAAGEEIFLDYGDAWESAWTAHVESWEGRGYSAEYISAHEWNRRHAADVIRTEEEQETDPYPDNLQIRCLPSAFYRKLVETNQSQAWTTLESGHECVVQSRYIARGRKDRYIVLYPDVDFDVEWAESFEDGMVAEYVVREQIAMADLPYTSDIFLDGVFRQPMGLPDHMLPSAWKGVKLSYSRNPFLRQY